MSAEPRAGGTSLWLMPGAAEKDRLAALIERLAARFGTTAFAPHVTLLPGVHGPERGVLDAARTLAAELAPFPIELSGVDGTESHFRCLFFRVRASGALREAHARAARRFGRDPDPAFDPHLSLLYGSLAAPGKAEIARELAEETATRFQARHIHVWRTDGAVGEWRSLGVFGLGDG